MTPEEKRDLVQFMGQVYGESKKNDSMLVGQSTNLKPKSNQVKQQVEQVLRSPVLANNPQSQPVQPPVAQPVVTPEQAALELAQAITPPVLEPTSTAPVVDPNQMEFDLSEPTKLDKVIELLEAQNKILLEIRDSSIQLKSNAKRAKNTKPR